MITIQIYQTKNYGQAAIYASGPGADAILSLTGRKTLLPSDIKSLQALGIAFEEIPAPSQLSAILEGTQP
jgi:hypothetical protein